jgi:hypothetical protein
MLDSLRPDVVSLEIMKGIPRENARISALLRHPARMVEDTIHGRFVALSAGLSRREAQREVKRPIADRISSASFEKLLEVFHPLFLRGRRFRVSEEMAEAFLNGNAEARSELRRQIDEFVHAEQDPQLRALAASYFTTTLNRVV